MSTEYPDRPAERPAAEIRSDVLKIIVTYLIAGISLFTALLAWWATAIDPAAFNRSGLQAILNAETTETMNTAALYKSVRAYTNFILADELWNQIDAGITQLHPRDRIGLEEEQARTAAIAPIRRRFFHQRYLMRDGSYDRQRQLDEAWAQANQNVDLDAARHFDRAQLEQIRKFNITLMVFGLTLAMFFFTVANALHPRRIKLRYAAACVGIVILLASIGSFLVLERPL